MIAITPDSQGRKHQIFWFLSLGGFLKPQRDLGVYTVMDSRDRVGNAHHLGKTIH